MASAANPAPKPRISGESQPMYARQMAISGRLIQTCGMPTSAPATIAMSSVRIATSFDASIASNCTRGIPRILRPISVARSVTAPCPSLAIATCEITRATPMRRQSPAKASPIRPPEGALPVNSEWTIAISATPPSPQRAAVTIERATIPRDFRSRKPRSFMTSPSGPDPT